MVKLTKHRFMLLIILSCWFSSAVFAATEVHTRLDAKAVTMGETFTVTYSIDGRPPQAQPNFQSLQKDFQIVSTSTNSAISIVNNHSSILTQWILTLSPKHTGTLMIPSIHIGDGQSQPQAISVTKASPTTTSGDLKDIFLSAQIAPENPYVQSQMIYTLNIYYDKNIQGAELTDPYATNTIIARIGRDRNFNKTIKGKNYHVLERKYAIFPQKSGTLTISPPIFSGQVLETDDVGGYFTTGWHTRRTAANEVKLDVQPIPAANQGHWWLPAQHLAIKENWSEHPPKFSVGQPITRTITIVAKGLSGTQLPNIGEQKIPGFQSYPDKPETTNQSTENSILGKRIEKIALIPDKAGKVTLPEITIPWWNTQTNQQEIARIPAHTYQIAAATGTVTAPPPANVQPLTLNQQTAQPQSTTQQAAPITVKAPVPTPSKTTLWQWLTGLFIFLWLLTLILLFRYTKQPRSVATDDQETSAKIASLRQLKQALEQACMSNDAMQTQQCLIAFAKQLWSEAPIRCLGDIAKQIGTDTARNTISHLDAILYTEDKQEWSGKHFWQVLKKELKKSAQQDPKKKALLPDLYL